LLANEFHIAELAAKLGYTPIDPAKMSIQEQITVFSQATHVAGAIGAALTNVVFAPSGCSVILSPHFTGADYYYFSNLMGALDHSLTYVLAPYWQTTEPWKVANNDFSIDAQSFRNAIESFETTGR
jgi:capsular polysaccharide biosynthesis protein